MNVVDDVIAVNAFIDSASVWKWFDESDSKHYSLENKLINYNKSQIKQLKEKSNWRNDYVILTD